MTDSVERFRPATKKEQAEWLMRCSNVVFVPYLYPIRMKLWLTVPTR